MVKKIGKEKIRFQNREKNSIPKSGMVKEKQLDSFLI